MSQFAAVFVDALRLLRARALFWVTLGISLFVALLYLSVGFNDEGVSVFFGVTTIENAMVRKGSPVAELLYLGIFSVFIVNLWLSWVAIALALITCAPIFPEFMAEGSAGVVLSKPISRFKLFGYKYLSGLLFAFLQTLVFCAIVFLAIRWRIGSWNPTVFWAVPLVVLMFSYLWSVMVAVGVRTRSVMASVLAAILLWFGCWLARAVEDFSYTAATFGEIPAGGGTVPLSDEEQAQWQARYPMAALAFQILPKTGDTVNLLNRLIELEGSREFSMSELLNAMMAGETRRDEQVEQALERHSTGFVLGSSLAFEALMFGFGAWVFCRRDY